MPQVRIITNSELTALSICERAGIVPMDTSVDRLKRSVDYILELADKIKNERANTTMQLAGQAAHKHLD